jgi:hypothetical protein
MEPEQIPDDMQNSVVISKTYDLDCDFGNFVKDTRPGDVVVLNKKRFFKESLQHAAFAIRNKFAEMYQKIQERVDDDANVRIHAVLTVDKGEGDE